MAEPVVVKRCADCPFRKPDESLWYCSQTPEWNSGPIPVLPDDGRPSWCPLPIAVKPDAP